MSDGVSIRSVQMLMQLVRFPAAGLARLHDWLAWPALDVRSSRHAVGRRCGA